MTWSIILAKYRRSILKDETPLLILTVCERAGLATEDEISRDTKIDLKVIRRVLFDLRLNQLIEYGSHFIRLTEGGKFVLSQLKLEEPIIDTFLDSLNINKEDEKKYKEVVKCYRNTAYKFYLNSLSTIRVWQRLAESVPVKENEKEKKAQTEAGTLILFLRDIRNWVSHYQPILENENISDIDDKSNLYGIWLACTLLHDIRHTKSCDKKEISSSENYYEQFCDLLQKKGLSSNDILKDREHSFARLLLAFHSFQASKEPDYWFNDWHEIKVELPPSKKFRNYKSYIKKIINSLETYSDIVNEFPDIDFKKFQSNWLLEESTLNNTENFVGKLLDCSSISELSNSTSINIKELKSLLDTIKTKCEDLISDE